MDGGGTILGEGGLGGEEAEEKEEVAVVLGRGRCSGWSGGVRVLGRGGVGGGVGGREVVRSSHYSDGTIKGMMGGYDWWRVFVRASGAA